MTFLALDDARIAYRVLGSGPPLVAPECNFTWSEVVEAQLAQHFTLIVASPRDYGLIYCFWGDRDTDAVQIVLSHEEYMAGLDRRGVPFDIYPGYDHEGLNSALEVALPAAIEWLRDQAAQEHL